MIRAFSVRHKTKSLLFLGDMKVYDTVKKMKYCFSIWVQKQQCPSNTYVETRIPPLKVALSQKIHFHT